MSVIQTLTEGIRERSLAHEGEALLGKWEKTGLLEGLNDNRRTTMARLLENQAAQLLKEQSTMAAGDVEGFASVAFPIVRRVFGNLLAQDLVSVQPMSLPSGLIFFLDFTYAASGALLNDEMRLASGAGESLYGGAVVAAGLINGVNLSDARGQQSFYGLNNGYSSPTGSSTPANVQASFGQVDDVNIVGSGTFYRAVSDSPGGEFWNTLSREAGMVSGTSTYAVMDVSRTFLGGMPTGSSDLIALVISGSDGRGGLLNLSTPVTALTDISSSFVSRVTAHFSGSATDYVRLAGVSTDGSLTAAEISATLVGTATTVFHPVEDDFAIGGALGSIVGTSSALQNGIPGWGLEANPNIPEIDIKVDSTAVTAVTKKLKAKWSPELAQDLNAYHNLDAEVELTSILSEQIALEIDQEILNDLVVGAKETLFWSRMPGKFVDRQNGTVVSSSLFPSFTGSVSEWYETLLETVNEVSARIHRKTLRGGANFIVCSPEVANILEFTSGFRASAAVDEESGSWGVKQVGSISRKMDIHVDPYFPRAVILVGRKGSSFLESGYVYAPYVPLQVTPTIFGTEDFVPRKGVMTRYAKKMVRPDMFGLVIVMDLINQASA
jgi:hypothetical protein